MNENLQRIAIAVTLGIALYAMGHNVDTWEFWAIIALLWTSNFLHYQDGVETGVSTAMEMWVDMTEQQRTDMIDLVTRVREDK